MVKATVTSAQLWLIHVWEFLSSATKEFLLLCLNVHLKRHITSKLQTTPRLFSFCDALFSLKQFLWIWNFSSICKNKEPGEIGHEILWISNHQIIAAICPDVHPIPSMQLKQDCGHLVVLSRIDVKMLIHFIDPYPEYCVSSWGKMGTELVYTIIGSSVHSWKAKK